MAEHCASDLEAAARLVARLGRATAAVAQAMPRRVEATDSTGTVQVMLGPDGLPESIEVAEDWLRTLGSEALGGAVEQACRAAADRRQRFWAEAVDQLPEPAEYPSVAAWAPPVPMAVPPRLVMEDLLAVLTDPDALPERATSATRGTGATGRGRLVLTLDLDGTVSCAADPHWVAQLAADELTDALDTVLASARDTLASATTGEASRQRVDDLLAGLWGIMLSAQ